MVKAKNSKKGKTKKNNVKKEKKVVNKVEVKDEEKVEAEVVDTKKETTTKKDTKKKEVKTDNTQKKSLWVRFRIFCHGVASETKKVHWTSKDKLIKYSISTVVFVIFLSLFFYGIDIAFAAIQALFK